MNGIWYYLKSDSDGIGSFELCNMNIEFGDEDLAKTQYPFWYKEGDDIDVSVFTLREKYKQDVLETMQFFIKESPIKTIVFHSRYQNFEEEPEFIYGVFRFDRFVELLNNNKILFNTCYIIRDTTL
jgi:hypothetical protein